MEKGSVEKGSMDEWGVVPSKVWVAWVDGGCSVCNGSTSDDAASGNTGQRGEDSEDDELLWDR